MVWRDPLAKKDKRRQKLMEKSKFIVFNVWQKKASESGQLDERRDSWFVVSQFREEFQDESFVCWCMEVHFREEW